MGFSRVIPLTIAAALFMENIDSTAIATALPTIAADLNVDPVVLKLAFTSYLISLAAFIPLSGWLADRFGARNVFRAAIVVFALASIGCASARSLEMLVAARAVQGMGGAMMIPVGRAILLRAVPKSEIVRAMVYLTVPALVGPLIGPPLGGFITETFNWRWIFWINLPVAALGLTLATLFMPDVRAEEARPFDAWGFVLTSIGLTSLVFGFTAVTGGFVPVTVALALAGFGLALTLAYVRHVRTRSFPILDLSLVRIDTLRASLLGGVLFRMGAGALAFMMPLMLQLGFGLDAFQSGSLTLAAALGAMSMKFAAPPLLKRFGFRTILISNALISAFFLFVYGGFSAATPHAVIFAVLLAGGFFRSLQFTSLGALGYADISPADTAQASTLSSVVQQFSIAAGVALAALVLDSMRLARGSDTLLASDFAVAFACMAVLTALSALAFYRLSPDAGAAVSGKVAA
jgi:EmrB/QacA subfamily drug resistance transporter